MFFFPSLGRMPNLQCINLIRPALAASKHYWPTGKPPDSPDCHSARFLNSTNLKNKVLLKHNCHNI